MMQRRQSGRASQNQVVCPKSAIEIHNADLNSTNVFCLAGYLEPGLSNLINFPIHLVVILLNTLDHMPIRRAIAIH